MFTGIVSDKGLLQKKMQLVQGICLRISTNYELSTIDIGASISCNGICLTVTDKGVENNIGWFEAEVWQETLKCTNVTSWKIGDFINLERAIKLGEELGGHLVSGHVDGVGKIVSFGNEGDALRVHIEVEPSLSKFLSSKGSVTVNGVSLTINSVNDNIFDVLLIQHTQKVTNLSEYKIGDLVNIEVDQLTKIIDRLLVQHLNKVRD